MVLNRLTGFVSRFTGPNNMLLSEILDLRDSYKERRVAMDNWYSLLKLTDELKQDKMESFVGNDPRTTWNLGTYLLQPRPLVHKIVSLDGTVIPTDTQASAEMIQHYFARIWASIDQREIKRGKHSWFWQYIGLMLATGWSALPYLIEPDGTLFVDYWNPATVYPEASDNPDEGLLRLARLRTISSSYATRAVQREGWEHPDVAYQGQVAEGQLWKLMPDSHVYHGVVIDNKVVKPLTIVPGLSKIPVIVSATGGLPDDGALDSKYLGNTGQSILASNEPLFRNFNRQQTFLQQLLRDNATPRIFEKSTGKQPIIDQERWWDRGAVFRGGPNDNIEILQMPGIPVELTQFLFTMQNQMQRGGFSNLTFGNIVQEVSATLISMAAESAMQLIEPFHMSAQLSLSEVTNEWYQAYLKNPGIRPKTWPDVDDYMLNNTRMISTYSVKIPGDFQNRISQAKALNAKFEMPLATVMEQLFPSEITNVREAIAQLDGERAKLHPMYQAVELIRAFEEAAQTARDAEDIETARMFDTVAGTLRQQLTAQPTPDQRTNSVPGATEEVIPQASMSDVRTGVENGHRA